MPTTETWSVDPRRSNTILNAVGYPVARAYEVNRKPGTATANAHLIAAAPAMAEALEMCRSALDELMGDTDPFDETPALLACQAASSALAQARGEPGGKP